MSWIGGSISSFTGQLSNLTKDILTEGTEEISDPATELRLAQEKIQQLDSIVTSQRQENERLKAVNKELEEKAESSELQINAISREYRGVLETKEREVNSLKHRHQELLEQHAHTASLSVPLHGEPVTEGQGGLDHLSPSAHHGWPTAMGAGEDFASYDYDRDQGDWDFGDSIQLQRDNNSLRSELQKLQSQVKHWRSVAGQLGQTSEQKQDEQLPGPNLLDLQHKIKDLESQVAKKSEDLQQQAASLHDHHRQKVASIKARHQEETQTLQQQVTALQQQLADAIDVGCSSQHNGSGNLPESDRLDREDELQKRLTEALQAKEKAQNARSHLEGMLEEVQEEVIRLQQQQPHQDSDASTADDRNQVEHLQKRIDELTEQLSDSGRLRQELERTLQEKSDLQQSLQSVKEEQEDVFANVESVMDQIGDREKQSLTAELVDSLEKENLVLKEEKLKLEEQLILSQNAAMASVEQTQVMHRKLITLKSQLRSFTGESKEDTDTASDTDLPSISSMDFSMGNEHSALHVGSEEVDKEIALLKVELARQQENLSGIEIERDDWQMEKEALEEVVTDLRKKNEKQDEDLRTLRSAVGSISSHKSEASLGSDETSQKLKNLESEISSLKADKLELETALEELDNQHSQVVEQLIAQRDKLVSQLAQSDSDIQTQRREIESLNATVLQLTESSSDHQQLEEKFNSLEKELSELKSKSESNNTNSSVLSEITELKEKLQKGGLVINDLHMDKQELKDQLSKAAEEVAGKVAKLKTMREENVQLISEKKDLEDKLLEMEERLAEMEEEVDKWQQINEERQVGQVTTDAVNEENKQLKIQIENMEKDKEVFKYRFQHLEDDSFAKADVSAIKDDIFKKMLEEEAKVRQGFEDNMRLNQELTGKVQKLKSDNQTLRQELSDLQKTSAENSIKFESDTQVIKSQLETALSEKSKLEQNLSATEITVEETGKLHDDISGKLHSIQQENSDLKCKLEDQKKHYDEYIEKLIAKQNVGSESLEAQHQKVLKRERENHEGINAMQSQMKEKADMDLKMKSEELEKMRDELSWFKGEMVVVREEISRLSLVCENKDQEILELKERMSQFDNDLEEIEESVCVAEDKHQLELSGRDEELKELKQRNVNLERSLSEMLPVEGSANFDQRVLQRSRSQPQQSKGGSSLPDAENKEGDESRLQNVISQLEVDLSLSNETIIKLHEEQSKLQDIIRCHEAGIVDLNVKADDQRRELDKAQSDVEKHKSMLAVIRQTSVDKETVMKEIHDKLNFLLTILTPKQVQKLQDYVDRASAIPALEFSELKAIGYSDGALEGRITSDRVIPAESTIAEPLASSGYEVDDTEDFDSQDKDRDRFMLLEQEMEDLRKHLRDKDTIVADLQKSNSSLLSLLENRGASGDKALTVQVATQKLEAELRSLRSEREQMMAVVTEKSRENSTMKAEVHRLMEVAAASQAALNKLLEDNRGLEQRQHSPARDEGEDDMKREALANLARLVRDRETEIEALKQKNETLLAVLQESGETQTAAHLGPLLRDKEGLLQQISAFTSEREQLIACVTQKHSESLAYHAEVQRLSALLTEAQKASSKAQNDYQALVPAFEDKSQMLISVQNELIKCKQRLAEMEVRHGELLQRSNSQDSPTPSTVNPLEGENERLRKAESNLMQEVSQRDERIHALTLKITSLEDSLSAKETESMHLKKQADNSKFQLTGLMAELADLKAERELVQEKSSVQDSETVTLRDSANKLTLNIREKENEISSLKEQITTLTSLLHGKQGEQAQVTKLVKENEAVMTTLRQSQQERDQQAMLSEQRLHECQALKAEMGHLKEREVKLTQELQRLRGHLIEIEEGYTKEALESEEREKELRNRLAVAEEQLLSSSSQVQVASQESSRQIESLQLQLEQAASQRDSAYMQVASTQEQCQQYATSLGNLQLVLEHFQKEKDSAIAVETERFQAECDKLKAKVKELQQDLEATRSDLVDALDGLEAASRLSEQLDKKEEAVRALREEVQLRENALSAAEEEIHKLTSNTEAKVDKTLMHNMVMTWLTSPERKRGEIVHLIGNILSFSKEDFDKIESVENKGNFLSGIFGGRHESAVASTPTKPTSANQSFSQLFVKFLERESSPPPSPVRLPAEAMAAETQHRHKPPAFNPFTAPRHVTHDGQRSSSPSSHLLMSHDTPAPSALFAPLTSAPGSGESAILSDVLGKR